MTDRHQHRWSIDDVALAQTLAFTLAFTEIDYVLYFTLNCF